MKFWFITRKEYEALDARLKDVERHFVTKRDPETGKILETLADRQERKFKPKRVKWNQLRRWLEISDGGRRIEKDERQRPS